jgi:hypothetical protein
MRTDALQLHSRSHLRPALLALLVAVGETKNRVHRGALLNAVIGETARIVFQLLARKDEAVVQAQCLRDRASFA